MKKCVIADVDAYGRKSCGKLVQGKAGQRSASTGWPVEVSDAVAFQCAIYSARYESRRE
jgi:hypothetical protein